MTKRISILTLLLIFSFSSLFSQSVSSGSLKKKKKNKDVTITFKVNADSYKIYINNNVIDGNSASVAPGVYRVTVKAKGFYDWTQDLNIAENMKQVVNLTPMTYKLFISTNADNSKIYIDNLEKGTGSFNGQLDPGTYTIVIRSSGFMDYKATVTLDRDVNLSAKLKELMAKVTINIPKSIINTKSKSALNDIKVFVDGKSVKGFNFELKPGNHLIRIESGGFAVEGQYKISGGKSYTIEPMISMGIE